MTALLTSAVLAVSLGQPPPPPTLTVEQADRRVHLTSVLAADRRYFDPDITEQDWANSTFNYVWQDGRVDRLTTFDYNFGRLGDELLQRFTIPQDLAPLPEYVIECESHGDPHAVNRWSGAGGLAQFLPGTWWAVGGHGLPQDASPEEQRYRAALLWANGAGASQWSCA